MTTITAPPTWHNGDVVQTQQPYDDFPITVARENGAWRGIGIPAEFSPGDTHTDAEITEWVYGEDGIAVVKIQQDHQWRYQPDPTDFRRHYPTECFLCGVKVSDLPEDERDELLV